MSSLNLPKGTVVPNHIVIIPDGNRRWARARGVSTLEGHKAGADMATRTIRASRELGVHTATFWGLSTENWRERDKREVEYLVRIIGSFIEENIKEAKRDGVRIVHLGRKDRLPSNLLDKIKKAEEQTTKNSKYVFNIALDYGGQDEIVRAVQRVVEAGVDPEKIDIKLLDSFMDTANQPYPYPDLIIRTSGEQRTSGILLWQAHYAEMYWENGHFPDFTPEKLREAVLDYSRRRRRFGGNDAMEHFTFKPEIAAKFELAWWRLSKIPEGTKFRDYAINHLKEQFGLSKKLAGEAAKLMLEAGFYEEDDKWEKARVKIKKFYKLIRDEVKLAFEPEIVTSLEIKLRREIAGKDSIHETGEAEETAKNLYAEVYRISVFQAAKLAHLRVLAAVERNLAQRGFGDYHWDKAEDYLQKFYRALKERVA